MDRVHETVPAVAAPIHDIAGPPTRLTFDAILEVDDDLNLTGRADARLVDVGRADVPQAGLDDIVLGLQLLRPEDADVRRLHGVVAELREPGVPLLGRAGDRRRQVG